MFDQLAVLIVLAGIVIVSSGVIGTILALVALDRTSRLGARLGILESGTPAYAAAPSNESPAAEPTAWAYEFATPSVAHAADATQVPSVTDEISAARPEPVAAIIAEEVTTDEAPTRRRGLRLDWEAVAGGRALNVVGAIVLLIGVGMFLKYAFDQNWIGPLARVALGLLGGSALLAGADRLYARATTQRWFVDGIAGAGLGILYLAGYAAFDVYHLVTFAAAYAFMGAVTVAGFVVGVRRDSLAVAIVGLAGGFIAPLLGFGVHASEFGLGSYLTLLDLGIVALTFVRAKWSVLEPLAMACTAGVVLAQEMLLRSDVTAAASATVAIAMWLPFLLGAAARTLRERSNGSLWTRGSVVAGGALLWMALSTVLTDDTRTLTIVGLSLVAVYAATFLTVLAARIAPNWGRGQWMVAAAALTVFALHASLSYADFSNALCAASVIWIAADVLLRRLAPRFVLGSELWCAGLATLCVAQASLLATDGATTYAPLRLMPPFDARDITIVSLIASWLFAVSCAPRFTGAPRWVRAATRQAVVLTLVYACSVHAQAYQLAAALAVLGIVATALAARTGLRDVQIAGLCLLAAGCIPMLGAPDAFAATNLHLFAAIDARDIAILAELFGWIAAGRVAARTGDLPGYVRIGARQAALLMLAFGLGAHERNYALAGSLAAVGLGAAIAGARSLLRDLEVAGIAFLAAAVAGILYIPQTWAYDRIFDFIPLHSARLVGSATVVAALVAAGEVYRRRSLIGRWLPRTMRLAAAGLGVLTVTTEVRNVFELEVARLRIDPQTGAVLEAILRAHNGQQLAITAAWIACSLALLTIGIRFQTRDLRLAAVGLFDLTVLKAFFVDLAALDTPYRIVSFVGLGVVLLAVSYIYQRIERGRPAGRPRLQAAA